MDVDGDGDTSEGIAAEIAILHHGLLAAIRGFAADLVGTPVVYDAGTYPYFFTDNDGDGSLGEGEAVYPNRYQSVIATPTASCPY